MDSGPEATRARKLDHIRLVVEADVEARHPTLLDDVRIIHRALPEIDLDDVSLETEFCGERVGAPIMITGMTGGHPEAGRINRILARIAEKYGLPIGVGSQRAAIEDPSLEWTYRVVREEAPNAFVVANLGAPQLSRGYGLREARKAVEMIDADALAIHLNPGQEAYQVEGDPYYAGVVERIVEIQEDLGVPVIVKETGTGLSMEDVRLLYRLGIRCFDVAGLGGTSWIKVEVLRGQAKGGGLPAGPISDYWGNPTAVAIIEARLAAPHSYIVGSGGVRSGLDAAKAVALGADLAGIALPAIRSLVRGGQESLERMIETLLYQFKTVLFMTGSRRPSDLWRAPVVLGGRILASMEARGVDARVYIYRERLEPLRVARWSRRGAYGSGRRGTPAA